MPDTDWIKELKPGDEVIVAYSEYEKYIDKIDSISRNGIKVGTDYYNRKGYISPKSIGMYGRRTKIEKLTPESAENIRHSEIVMSVSDKMRTTHYSQLSYSQAVRILEILNEKEQPKE